jgi:hypothetical protein
MNVAKSVAGFIDSHPNVKSCLKKGMVNYSALSREIIKDSNLEKRNFEAVLVACRRYAEKARLPAGQEKHIIALLRKSSFEIKNKVCVVIISNAVPFSSIIELASEITKERSLFHLIEGSETFTIISEQKFYQKIIQRFKHRMIDEKKDLVEIMVKMPKEIEQVPGITGYLYSLFGENDINILETMSSWTDTLFVIEEKDVEKAMRILRV